MRVLFTHSLPVELAMLRAAAFLAVISSAAFASAAERPNIVFIYADDHGPWAMGAAGCADARTPNMDRLVREGAYLTRAYTTTPVCSPSRAGLMASRYGSELGITDWINPKKEPEHGLDTNYVTWPEVLAEAGYETGLVGKWHLGTLDQFHPSHSGYKHFMGFRAGGTTPKDPMLEVEGEERTVEGFEPEILADEAIAFLTRKQKVPFLLSLHFRAPHAPWLPLPESDWSAFQNHDPTIPNPDYPDLDVEKLKRITNEYLASVACVDRNVGRVLDELDTLGLSQNTVVIYTSDHGYNMGHNGIWHKGNGHWILKHPPAATENIPEGERPNMYDLSLRVPAIVRWPAAIKPGTVVDRTVTNLDWYPTLLAMAGLDVPKETTIRGRNFLPLLRGENVEWNDDLYAEYSLKHSARAHLRTYRTAEWKLIRDFLNPGRDELYHLTEDPAETTNLIDSADPQAKAAIDTLHARILEKMRELRDPVLESVAAAASRDRE